MPDPRAIIIVCILVATFVAGWKVKAWQVASVELAVKETRDAAMDGAAEAIAKIKVTNTTVYQKAVREIIEKPVYRDCRHDPAMLEQINAALVPPP